MYFPGRERRPFSFPAGTALTGGFGHEAGTKAAGADFDPLGSPVYDGAHLLEVGLPSGFGFIVRVTYVISGLRSFAAYLAYS